MGLEVIYGVQVGTSVIDLTPAPPRSAMLPVGAVCSPEPELSGPSPEEKIDAGWEEQHDQPQGP